MNDKNVLFAETAIEVADWLYDEEYAHLVAVLEDPSHEAQPAPKATGRLAYDEARALSAELLK